MNSSQPVLKFENIGKRFGNFWANRNIHFEVERGSIHALVGENGAGKTTAMKILFGLLHPDEGCITVEGKAIAWKTPQDAVRHGIGMVHQHFMLANALSLFQNIILGTEETKSFLPKMISPMETNKVTKKINELYSILGFAQNLKAPISDLSIGDQQRVEILKLLYQNARILIFDEPTAVFSPPEVEIFLKQLLALKQQGKTVILISHKLDEILKVADRVTILRKGTSVETVEKNQLDKKSLADKIVGKVLQQDSFHTRTTSKEELIKISQLTLHAGEIYGVAGVEGNGQNQLIENVLSTATAAKIFPLGYIPADRYSHAMIADQSLLENFAVNAASPLRGKQPFLIDWKKLKEQAVDCCKIVSLSTTDITTPMESLSGGNQQKFIVGRELFSRPKCLVISQPTRGVDIAASQSLRRLIFQAREEGAAILLISSDLEELFMLSDRIGVIYRNNIVAEYNQSAFSEKEIGQKMIGLS